MTTITVLYNPSNIPIGASINGVMAAVRDALASGALIDGDAAEVLADYAVGLPVIDLCGYTTTTTHYEVA